jgi:hypothetical protein
MKIYLKWAKVSITFDDPEYKKYNIEFRDCSATVRLTGVYSYLHINEPNGPDQESTIC